MMFKNIDWSRVRQVIFALFLGYLFVLFFNILVIPEKELIYSEPTVGIVIFSDFFRWVIAGFIVGFIVKRKGWFYAGILGIPMLVYLLIAIGGSIWFTLVREISVSELLEVYLKGSLFHQALMSFVFVILGGILGQKAYESYDTRMISKGVFGAVLGYFIIHLMVVLIGTFLKSDSVIFLSGHFTINRMLLFSGALLLSSYMTISKSKLTYWILNIISILISITFFTIVSFILNEFSALILFFSIFGGYVSYLSKKSIECKYFVLFSLPSFLSVPASPTGEFVDEAAKEAWEKYLQNYQAGFGLITGSVLALILSLEEYFGKSPVFSIIGTISGVALGVLGLLLIGTLIRKLGEIGIIWEEMRK